jgi:pilus assembly protein CpaB
MFPQGFDVHRRALRVMEAGEVVMQVKATAPGQDAGVASRLGEGMRAFTIRVDASSGVSGFVRPGDA